MNLTRYKNHIHLHFIVFLYGFTAIIGKLIDLEAMSIVLYRMTFAALGLYLFILFRKNSMNMKLIDFLKVIGVGLVVGLHWVTFFHAIKISNISVTLGCLASTTLLTSFLEPVIEKKRIFWVEVLLGLLIIIGLYLIFQFEARYSMGIIVALISAAAAGLFTVFNKTLIRKHNANVISFYEMIAGAAGVAIYMGFTNNLTVEKLSVNWVDLMWLVVLAIICTSYAFAATIEVMKELSAYFVVLSINLEPVYGIIMAFFIFGESEQMTAGFYLGTGVILFAVFSYPFLKRMFKRQMTA